MKILFINRTLSRAQEALDALLMASTFDQEVSVLFLDDGVWQLKSEQKSTHTKNFSAAFKAFPLYNIDKVYVDEKSLHDRGLALTDLLIMPVVLNTTEIKTLLAQQDHILSF